MAVKKWKWMGGGGDKAMKFFAKCSERSRKEKKKSKVWTQAWIFHIARPQKHTQKVKFGKPQSAKNENNV